MDKSPAEILGGLLQTAGVVKATPAASEWGWKVGFTPDTPSRLVTMMDTGGQNPNPRWGVDFVMVQALVRGDINDYGATWGQARKVRDTLLGFDSADAPTGDRIDSIIVVGDIATLGNDSTQRPILSVNFRVIIEPQDVGANRVAL